MVSDIHTVDDYIARFPEHVQILLQKVRKTIKQAAPEATEKISYAMPAFVFNGMLVYFAGYKSHIGFYPGAAGIANFQKEISGYKNAKGSVQFPLDKPIPFDLITKIVQFRVKQNLEKAAAKDKPKTDFLSLLSAPARRALESKNIITLKQLSKYKEADVLAFHGIGPSSIPILKQALKAAQLSFKK